jgi:hypothetical protein
MAGATENYGFAIFNFGDPLDSVISAQMELDRFVLIDKQLFGLYSIFGDGVISGWSVVDADGLNLQITPGVGIISSLAAETTFPEDIQNLPADDEFSIYATIQGDTPTNRSVRFVFSRTSITAGAILIANVTTGSTGIESIDNLVRQQVGFKSIIEEEIKNHRHTGSPPKIQLDTETKGLLPGSRLGDQDAAILTSGKLLTARLSQIDHTKLINVGFLTHAQLDSLVGALQRDNEQLLGEVASINLLKAVVFAKYKDVAVDQYFVNELAIIPGISPYNFTDWEATTAVVNESNECISGLPASFLKPGPLGIGSEEDLEVVNIVWETDADFERANAKSNIKILSGVLLSADAVEDLVVEDFEITQNTNAGFAGSISEETSASVTHDSSTAAQGFNSGKFETKHTFSATFTKEFSSPLDWTNFDELVVYVRSFSASHASVHLRIDDADGEEITTYTLLASDETTSLDENVLTGGFAEKIFSINNLVRSEIGSITIYTDEINKDDEIFYIDNIFVRNTSLLMPQGTLRLRYSSASPTIFRSVDFDAIVPVGTDFRVRIRTGMDVPELLSAPFSTRLNSGDVFSIVGREIEIDITFFSDKTRTFTPVLTRVDLQALVESNDVGFTISDANSWERGTLDNIQVGTIASDDFIKLKFTNVGDMYFIFGNAVNELDPSLIPQFGINGASLPISPEQGFKSLSSFPTRGFVNPKSVMRLTNGDFLVADTGNDRVVQVTADGDFVRGFGSHNRDYDKSATYGLSAVYNKKIGKLFITYSKGIALDTFDLRNIHINWGSNVITLDNVSDIRKTLLDEKITYNPQAATFKIDRVLSVELSASHQALLKDINIPLYVQIDTDPDLHFIECFYGDFLYYARGAIIRPIFAAKFDDARWMIGNSHVFTGYDDLQKDKDDKKDFDDMITASRSIINVDEDSGQITFNSRIGTFDFQYNAIDFSEITLGGIYSLPKDRLLVGGIRKKPTTSTTTPSTDTTVSLTDKDRLKDYQGFVIVVDKSTQRLIFKYESPEGLFPSDVLLDDDGLYVVSESSFTAQAGRIISLDPLGNIASIISDGMYTKINDIRKLPAKHLLVST